MGKKLPLLARLDKLPPQTFELVLAIIFQGETCASSWQVVNMIVIWGRAWFRSGSNLLGASCVVRRSAAARNQCRAAHTEALKGPHSEMAVNRRREERCMSSVALLVLNMTHRWVSRRTWVSLSSSDDKTKRSEFRSECHNLWRCRLWYVSVC